MCCDERKRVFLRKKVVLDATPRAPWHDMEKMRSIFFILHSVRSIVLSSFILNINYFIMRVIIIT